MPSLAVRKAVRRSHTIVTHIHIPEIRVKGFSGMHYIRLKGHSHAIRGELMLEYSKF